MGVQKRTRKFAQTKRVIGQRDARLKKNIVAEEQKQKEKKGKGDELIREMYVVHTSHVPCTFMLTLHSQPSSPLEHVFRSQYRPTTALPGPHRHELSVPHCSPQATAPVKSHGCPLRHLPTHYHELRYG